MDNRRLSPSQLGVLRQKVVEAVIEKGYKQNEVSRLLGISTNSVSKYIRSYRQEGEVSLIYRTRDFISPKGTLKYNRFSSSYFLSLLIFSCIIVNTLTFYFHASIGIQSHDFTPHSWIIDLISVK
jgi:hypothetical protein